MNVCHISKSLDVCVNGKGTPEDQQPFRMEKTDVIVST